MSQSDCDIVDEWELILDQAHAEGAKLREQWLTVQENKESKEWMEANADKCIPNVMLMKQLVLGPAIESAMNSVKNDDDDSD